MNFTIKRARRIVKELEKLATKLSEPIKDIKYKSGELTHSDSHSSLADMKPFSGQWGGRDSYTTFGFNVTVPKNYKALNPRVVITTGKEKEWNATNPQFLCYVNGRLKQGLDVNHREIDLSVIKSNSNTYTILLEGWSGMHESMSDFSASLNAVDPAIEALYYDLYVANEVAAIQSPESLEFAQMTKVINAALNYLDLREPYSLDFYKSIEVTAQFLAEEFYGKFSGNPATLCAVGHTHIDVGWLWRIIHSHRKTARSFSTVLDLMAKYPEYLFSSSQPALYEFIKSDYPELYEKLKVEIAENRFEPEGAMFVEADCNLISGESMLRQIMYGKRFFKEEFGKDNHILWLPDVFGYSGAMPQILLKCGVDCFITSKISWNEYNRLPHETFMWEGIDGSRILTHFHTMPTDDDYDRGTNFFATYNGRILPKTVAGTWDRYQDKALSTTVMASYGYGDGGGGPTSSDLEIARRLADGFPRVPQVNLSFKDTFVKRLQAEVEKRGFSAIPERWVGELYLELHRGTLTTMSRNKRDNRKCELLFRDTEFAATIDELLCGDAYPKVTFDHEWKRLLVNQFHDILPGSSIHEVYEDSAKDYALIYRNLNAVKSQALSNLAAAVKSDSDGFLVFNPAPHCGGRVVTLPETLNWDSAVYHGETVPIQIAADGSRICYLPSLPSMGYALVTRGSALPSVTAAKANATAIETPYYSIMLDDCGEIISFYDKQNDRQVLRDGGKANRLTVFEDKPMMYDAWDINIFHHEKPYPVGKANSIRVTESGPVRTAIEIVREFNNSTICQTMYLYNASPVIDFVTNVDWKETQHLLKAIFDVDIHATKATYDIQFGNIERPTHKNTSWEEAKFEVCGHKWMDMSEDGYGVALLNDSKYGHSVFDGSMELSLLKSSTSPNYDADKETHTFTYSLQPHAASFRQAGVIDNAYALNCPATTVAVKANPSGELYPDFSFVSVNKPNVIIETVKQTEASDGIVIRVYEAFNRREKVTLSLGFDVTKAFDCDMLENECCELPLTNPRTMAFDIKPFEVKTIKLKL